MTTAKEVVRLREKKLATGMRSLYLDIYLNGKRKYEFLKLYLLPETTRENKAENKRVLALANAVKAKRILEVQNNRFGFETDNSKSDFIEYVKTKASQTKNTDATKRSYDQLIRRLDEYFDGAVSFSEINEDVAQDLYNWFVDRFTSANSVNSLFMCFKKFVRMAIKDKLLREDVTMNVERVGKFGIKERQYLTIDEVRKLTANIQEPHATDKKAFVFSCLTGLRYSDVASVRWDNISTDGDRMRITMSQQKTKGQMYIDLNKDARTIIESMERKDDGLIFSGIDAGSYINVLVAKWVRESGIEKHVTFHCARHTFACMMIELNVDLYTISKLLGHSDIKTTQIYAKMVDKKKREAVDLIPSVL